MKRVRLDICAKEFDALRQILIPIMYTLREYLVSYSVPEAVNTASSSTKMTLVLSGFQQTTEDGKIMISILS